MTGIQPLSSEVVHLIAAGETIDSMAAVVRELIENAIDAKATRAHIQLWTDSMTVRVTDNGVGMSLEDLLLAATGHATSKIASTDDLHRVTTLGFRGEALHSLAQLSDLEICSRRQEHVDCWQIRYTHTGEAHEAPRTVAIAPGTVVTASRIFSTRPARLQLLPGIAQQVRKVQQTIHHAAIANPQITWQVHLDGRPWMTIFAGTSVRDILPQIATSIYPHDLVEATYLHGADAGIQIALGLPDRISRRRPDWVKVVVNGRFVQFPEIEQSILATLARTLPRHRFPICILHLQVPADRLDWNRHPAKTEVYLHDLPYWQAQVGAAIAKTLQAHLGQAEPGTATQSLLRLAEASGAYNPRSPLLQLKALAQVHNTYILAEHPTGLWLVEQHVAHERILFEALEAQWQVVTVAPPVLVRHLTDVGVERLQTIPLEIEPFGEDLWAVRSLPRLLVGREDCPEILQELSRQEDLKSMQATAACRSAWRNGSPLDLETMQDLLERWQQTRHPQTCPHGRPIYLTLASHDLARFFRRNWIVNPQ